MTEQEILNRYRKSASLLLLVLDFIVTRDLLPDLLSFLDGEEDLLMGFLDEEE